MTSFKDTTGREWTIAIDGPIGLRVRQECDPGFLKGDEDPESSTLARLGADKILRMLVIQVFCDEQRKKLGLSVEEFWQALHDGDVAAAACDALSQAIINFTEPQRRPLLQAIWDKQREVLHLGSQKAVAQINNQATNNRLVAALDKQLAAASEEALTRFENATPSPATAASTPPASGSAS